MGRSIIRFMTTMLNESYPSRKRTSVPMTCFTAGLAASPMRLMSANRTITYLRRTISTSFRNGSTTLWISLVRFQMMKTEHPNCTTPTERTTLAMTGIWDSTVGVVIKQNGTKDCFGNGFYFFCETIWPKWSFGNEI